MFLRIPVLFILFAVFSTIPAEIHANKSIADLQKQYDNANHDTVRIRVLFNMGNYYLSGPSDSLIYYYQKALVLVNKNLESLKWKSSPQSPIVVKLRDFKIRSLIELGIEYFFQSNYEKSLEYYFEALEIVKGTDDIELLSECYSEIGIVYKNQGKFDQALEYYNQALYYAGQTADTSWVASCKINIGNVYKEKGYLTVALNYYFDALATFELLNHSRRLAACYQNIGDIYRKQLDYNKALEYYSRSLQLAFGSNDKVRIMNCYLNIGYVYFYLDEFRIARRYYDQAYDLYMELGYSHELDDCYILIGDTYLEELKLDSAIIFYDLAFAISMAEEDVTRLAEIQGKLGEIYMIREDYPPALRNILESIQMAEEVGSLDLRIRATETLAEIYECTGDLSRALEEYKNFTRLKDSLFNAEKYKALTEMEVKYESDKKGQQLALLEERSQVQQLVLSRRNRLYISSLLVLGLLGGLAYILYRNQRLKSRHKSIELEQKLMRSQMNPHFIFNSMIAIQSYIYSHEAVKAGDYLAKFADLIRITLESSRSEFVPLEKELKMLNAYLELQVLRFDNKFTYSIQFSPEIETDPLQIPPMLAQPFIENAIEHGVRHKEDKGFILINFEKQNGTIRCSVEDDGVGRKKAREASKNKVHQSMATSITRERLDILSKKYKRKFDLEIIDQLDENGHASGTKVVFEMPYRIKEE